jgi:CheY-like chemotaxis protein
LRVVADRQCTPYCPEHAIEPLFASHSFRVNEFNGPFKGSSPPWTVPLGFEQRLFYTVHRISRNCERVYNHCAHSYGYDDLQVPKRILIVDDSPAIRKMLRETLGCEAGWEICGEAGNGREGIERARDLKPDLIVLDLAMPVMNGLEAARELTRLLPAVPLIMFTSYETTHLKREALAAGIRSTVLKAGSVEPLLRSIQSLLEPVS